MGFRAIFHEVELVRASYKSNEDAFFHFVKTWCILRTAYCAPYRYLQVVTEYAR